MLGLQIRARILFGLQLVQTAGYAAQVVVNAAAFLLKRLRAEDPARIAVVLAQKRCVRAAVRLLLRAGLVVFLKIRHGPQTPPFS